MRAGDVLARAFSDDPLFVWSVPDRGRREAVLTASFRAVVRVVHARGTVIEDDDGLAVATYVSSENYGYGLADVARFGFWRVAKAARAPLPLARLVYSDESATRFFQRLAPARHGYLWAIGVDAAARGQGRARRLIEAVEERARADGHAHLVLRTETERNVGLYERLGFRVLGTRSIPRTPLTTWAMQKELR